MARIRLLMETVLKLFLVEGVSGLSRDESIRVGKLFKQGLISVSEKNIQVLSGQDSLNTTFKESH